MREIYPRLKKILDDRAGKTHSETGIVMQTLGEILDEYDRITSRFYDCFTCNGTHQPYPDFCPKNPAYRGNT